MDRRIHGLAGNGRACADCHMPADFQLSPASAGRDFNCSSGAASSIRRRTIRSSADRCR
jgi:hypothetical protein